MLKQAIVILLFAVVSSLVFAIATYPDGKLRVVACDVGQGDALLITKGFTQVLIDGGPNDLVLSCLGKYLPFYDRRLEMVVLTHPQADHVTGLVEVAKRYKIGLVVASPVNGDTRYFDQLVDVLIANDVDILAPRAGDVLRVGDLKWKIWWPPDRVGGENGWQKLVAGEGESVPFELGGMSVGDLNQISTVIKLEYGLFSALFTGDIADQEELAITRGGLIDKVVLLKVAHHGSKYSSTSGFLEGIQPQVAVASVGKNNWFGHPSSDTLIRLDEVGAKLYRTDVSGDVVVETDGRSFRVRE